MHALGLVLPNMQIKREQILKLMDLVDELREVLLCAIGGMQELDNNLLILQEEIIK